jgi:hypothetical protein|uniref:Uncharacterized protein n=2 Tax=Picea TaxID=3328 RepID=A0A101LXE4_PICGL|nr:hypothetical protein ABT39_MTgene6132 [Picea glauca]QHR92809.1 hypothetical protein Q903MT_gene6857 [Picea sitchensis]
MGGIGHWTNRCFNLRHRIQDLIDAGLLRFEKDESKVNQNASPVKGNVEGSPLTDVATKGREGLDSSLLTSSPVAIHSQKLASPKGMTTIERNRLWLTPTGSKFERFLQLTQAGKAQLRKQL